MTAAGDNLWADRKGLGTIHSCIQPERVIDRCISILSIFRSEPESSEIIEGRVPHKVPPDEWFSGKKRCLLHINLLPLMV